MVVGRLFIYFQVLILCSEFIYPSVCTAKQPRYILLNLAIGGANGGDPAHTTFPKRFEIDCVGVYQSFAEYKITPVMSYKKLPPAG